MNLVMLVMLYGYIVDMRLIPVCSGMKIPHMNLTLKNTCVTTGAVFVYFILVRCFLCIVHLMFMIANRSFRPLL